MIFILYNHKSKNYNWDKYIEDDEIETYSIVGSTEADPMNNKISNESPIAKGIMGKKVNDIVSIESPNGSYNVQIISIK